MVVEILSRNRLQWAMTYRSDIIMKIETLDGMVGITGDRFSYSNIRGMYQTGSGHGLQLSADLEHKRGELLDLFSGIAEKIYEAQDVTREGKNENNKP